MMVGGAVLLPVGLGVAMINSVEKCEPDMPGFGPCSESGPNQGASMAGLVTSGGGLLLFLTGLLTVATD